MPEARVRCGTRPLAGWSGSGSSWGMGAAVGFGACGLGVITFGLAEQSSHRAPDAGAAGPPRHRATRASAAETCPVAGPAHAADHSRRPPHRPRRWTPQVSSDPQRLPWSWTSATRPLRAPATTTTTLAQACGARRGKDAAGDDELSADERFSDRVSGSNVDVAHASRIHDLSHIAPQGTVIPAVLETAINSDLPGFVRAVVSRDVRGFDGTTVLIPRGSKLIGQYRSGVALSQTRAFVVWSRVITPDGVSIDIGSPGTDDLGRGGLEGETDTHFFQRFGSAILLSVMGAGLERFANSDNSGNTAIIIGSQQQASQVASIALQKQIDIPATITVPQGTPLQVFVTRDLDFAGVSK